MFQLSRLIWRDTSFTSASFLGFLKTVIEPLNTIQLLVYMAFDHKASYLSLKYFLVLICYIVYLVCIKDIVCARTLEIKVNWILRITGSHVSHYALYPYNFCLFYVE